MADERYKVTLVITSNFAGNPDKEYSKKCIKDYLELMRGLGLIEVTHVEQLLPPSVFPEEPPTKRDSKSIPRVDPDDPDDPKTH